MSEKEKNLVEQLAELPEAVQDKFLLMAQGAAVAVECAREAAEAPHQSASLTASPRGSQDAAEDGGTA